MFIVIAVSLVDLFSAKNFVLSNRLNDKQLINRFYFLTYC